MHIQPRHYAASMKGRRFTDKQHAAALSRDPARAFVHSITALRMVRACPFCKYMETAERGRGKGRGYGLAVGGGLSAIVGAHIRREHADLIAEIKAEALQVKAEREAAKQGN